jgi:hypothetical protein
MCKRRIFGARLMGWAAQCELVLFLAMTEATNVGGLQMVI